MATKSGARNGSYSELVTRYSRALANELDALSQRQSDSVPGAGGAGAAQDANAKPAIRTTTPDRYLAIDTHGAEMLESGTRILPEPGGAAANWCIFTQNKEPGAPPLKAFSLVGILPQRLTAAEFVEQAYQMVLLRPVDDAGRQSYERKLETGALTRRSVLRSLAGSKEARTKGITLIITVAADEWGSAISSDAAKSFAIDTRLK